MVMQHFNVVGTHANDISASFDIFLCVVVPLQQNDYMSSLRQANPHNFTPTIASPTVPQGGCAIHHQDTWHGSGPNFSIDLPRRALALHYIRADVTFIDRPDYIYGRYKLRDSNQIDETFFPIVYRPDGYRTHDDVEDITLAAGVD
jgi:hypothetical protein